MVMKAGYWVDLSTVKLDDATGTSTWIQAMPLGEYEHPVHGTISITPERIKRFAANVAAKVRGQDLDIDYDHKAQTGEAAGWVRDAQARDDGLWLFVEWTKDAFTKIKSKAYRYFSPEFVDEWEHPKTHQKFQDVLFGGGITNRPFLKDILPINMSELDAVAHDTRPAEGGSMDPKELRTLLGLPEDATDEQVNTKLADALKPKENPPEPESKTETKTEPELVSATEQTDDIVKLAETSKDPVIKELARQLSETRKQAAESAVALRLAETATRVVQLSEVAKAKKFDFPPAVKELLTTSLNELPKAQADKVYDAFKKLAETGVVALGELGGATPEPNTDAIKRFTDEIARVQKADNLGYADAVSKITSEQPQLFEEYRQASFAGVE
jgi:phage I-like protein